MTPGSRLVAKDLVVTRGTRAVLDGVSFDVAAGTIATLEGASGSGKTTLLRVLATLTEPDRGTVSLDGHDARALSPRAYRTRVAYVPQLPPMLPGTVAQNVAEGPRLRGLAMGGEAVAEVLARVGLDAAFCARSARELSGGEKQRVALARALANAPDVLLLDEPTSALDAAAAARVLDLVKKLAADGLAVVVVTHVEAHAAALGGDRWVLDSGRIARRAGAA